MKSQHMILVLTAGLATAAVHAQNDPAREPPGHAEAIQCLKDDAAYNDLRQDYSLPGWLQPEPDLDVEQYQDNIGRIESESGAYDHLLAPQLIGLGLRYRDQGRREQAAAAFRQALHLIRVYRGLYHPDQLPVLDLAIESGAQAGEWEEVAAEYDVMEGIYRYNYNPDDPRLLPALKRLRRWHQEAYNKDTGRTLAEHFSAADALYRQGVSIIEGCTGNHRLALCFWNRACCADSTPDMGTCPEDR